MTASQSTLTPDCWRLGKDFITAINKVEPYCPLKQKWKCLLIRMDNGELEKGRHGEE